MILDAQSSMSLAGDPPRTDRKPRGGDHPDHRKSGLYGRACQGTRRVVAGVEGACAWRGEAGSWRDVEGEPGCRVQGGYFQLVLVLHGHALPIAACGKDYPRLEDYAPSENPPLSSAP